MYIENPTNNIDTEYTYLNTYVLMDFGFLFVDIDLIEVDGDVSGDEEVEFIAEHEREGMDLGFRECQLDFFSRSLFQEQQNQRVIRDLQTETSLLRMHTACLNGFTILFGLTY